MYINGTVRIELDYDQQHKTLVEILKQEYGSLAIAVNRYAEARDIDLLPWQREDHKDDLRVIKAIDDLLWNYMSDTEYSNWKTIWKKTRAIYG
jgi:hypothetical protein